MKQAFDYLFGPLPSHLARCEDGAVTLNSDHPITQALIAVVRKMSADGMGKDAIIEVLRNAYRRAEVGDE